MVILRMKRVGALAALLWATALAPAGAVPPGFNIQGRLTDANGVNREGNYSIKFTLYDVPTGGAALWTRTYTALTVRNGNFQTVIGDVAGQPMLSDVFAAGDARHLEIQVLSGPGVSTPEQPLVPRQQLVSVPYSLRSASAGGIISTGAAVITAAGTEGMRVLPNGNVGVGTANPAQKLSVAGTIESTSGGFRFPDGSVQSSASGSALVQKQTITAAAAVTFSGLSPGVLYRVDHYAVQNISSGGPKVRFNGDVGANYNWYVVGGSGQSAGSERNTADTAITLEASDLSVPPGEMFLGHFTFVTYPGRDNVVGLLGTHQVPFRGIDTFAYIGTTGAKYSGSSPLSSTTIFTTAGTMTGTFILSKVQ